jgi:hypothetical protein
MIKFYLYEGLSVMTEDLTVGNDDIVLVGILVGKFDKV